MILILNCGSQSFKYKVFGKNLNLLGEKVIMIKNQRNYQKEITRELAKVKESYGDVKVIGHRVVHGGSKFRKLAVITAKTLKEAQKYNKFAPLHNHFNILGIKESIKIFPKSKQAADFDTGFYESLPEEVFTYPLPEKIRNKYGFRKFGFHGISHEYAAEIASEKLKRPFKKLKIISCHLGGGSSITAIKNGKAVETSMGFTPLEGLMMMTRAGDLDSGVVLELARIFSIKKAAQILNQESGLKGICGCAHMKDVLKKIKQGDKKSKLALRIFTYRIQKYIGSYCAVLGGCDVLVFTGAIGAGSAKIRQMICNNLSVLKTPIKTKILAIEPNEELAIAKKIKKYAR